MLPFKNRDTDTIWENNYSNKTYIRNGTPCEIHLRNDQSIWRQEKDAICTFIGKLYIYSTFKNCFKSLHEHMELSYTEFDHCLIKVSLICAGWQQLSEVLDGRLPQHLLPDHLTWK